ncbi:MAG TPA: ABC transporter ATP-binding protein [Candidatus Acidoferrales bacterium]|nr:ABC transporter ATP-binding protein [Candidatus Acidoferrales bacterium]
MSDITVELDKVAKRYLLRRGWYVTSIKDEVGRLTARVLRRPVPPREEFWALRDITFSLKRGEVLGLVGPNGAGKSTLLKILSRVTVPTSGSFVVHGRLGALIEIGAGFHPELTGRENIGLNGVILGMSRREIQSKFDRIVAFAELERFIDTPIKYYSSGMQMRLGFAVAAHTDPDVLLIDEILAVGDASFQVKCSNKLAELKEQDKTIILCSHSLSSITDHAKTVLWVDGGRVRMLGEADAVVDAYLEHVTAAMSAEEETAHAAEVAAGQGLATIHQVVTMDGAEQPQTRFDRGDRVLIDITYSAIQPLPGAVFGVSVHDIQGHPLGGVVTDPDSMKITAPVERGVLRLTLDPTLFNRGAYTLNVHIFDPKVKRYYDVKRRITRFAIEGARAGTAEYGHIHYPHQWENLR